MIILGGMSELKLDRIKEKAIEKKDFTYYHQFSDDQIVDMKNKLIEALMGKQELDEERRRVLNEINNRADEFIQKIERLTKLVRSGGIDSTTEVYLVPDHNKMIMNYYRSSDGKLIHQRELNQSENQLRIQ